MRISHGTVITCFVLLLTSATHADPFITKDNQASDNCNLVVQVGGLPGWRHFTVIIPKDNPRPKGIGQVYFVIGENGSPTNYQAMVPVRIEQKQDGTKTVEVYVGRTLLKGAFLQFHYIASPVAPPQWIALKLDSYIDAKGNQDGANQLPDTTRKLANPQQ